MAGQHLFEQWALDQKVATEVKWGIAQHLVDRFALLFAHPVLLLSIGCSAAV